MSAATLSASGRQAKLHVPVVVGHDEDDAQSFLRRSDLPALAYVIALRHEGRYLVADLGHLAPITKRLIETHRYNSVSAEIYPNAPDGIDAQGMVLRRVAFLGGDQPEIKTLGGIPMPEPGTDGEVVRGVRIFAQGIHREKTYSAADLDEIVDNFDRVSAEPDQAERFHEGASLFDAHTYLIPRGVRDSGNGTVLIFHECVQCKANRVQKHCGGEGGKPGPCPEGGPDEDTPRPKFSKIGKKVMGKTIGQDLARAVAGKATIMEVNQEDKLITVQPHSLAHVATVGTAADQFEAAHPGWNVVVRDPLARHAEVQEFCGGKGSKKPGPCPKGRQQAHKTVRAHANAAAHQAGKTGAALQKAQTAHGKQKEGTKAHARSAERLQAAQEAHGKTQGKAERLNKKAAALEKQAGPAKVTKPKTALEKPVTPSAPNEHAADHNVRESPEFNRHGMSEAVSALMDKGPGIKKATAKNDKGEVGAAISFEKVKRSGEPIDADGWVYIRHLGSDGSIKGAGTEMIRHALQAAVRSKTGLYLSATPNAEAFYEKVGFKHLNHDRSDLLGVDRNESREMLKRLGLPVAKPAPTKSPHEHVADAVKTHGGEGNLAPLRKVRAHLASKGIADRGEQDAAINDARKKGSVSGVGLEGGRGSKPEDVAAALHDTPESRIGHLALNKHSEHLTRAPRVSSNRTVGHRSFAETPRAETMDRQQMIAKLQELGFDTSTIDDGTPDALLSTMIQHLAGDGDGDEPDDADTSPDAPDEMDDEPDMGDIPEDTDEEPELDENGLPVEPGAGKRPVEQDDEAADFDDGMGMDEENDGGWDGEQDDDNPSDMTPAPMRRPVKMGSRCGKMKEKRMQTTVKYNEDFDRAVALAVNKALKQQKAAIARIQKFSEQRLRAENRAGIDARFATLVKIGKVLPSQLDAGLRRAFYAIPNDHVLKFHEKRPDGKVVKVELTPLEMAFRALEKGPDLIRFGEQFADPVTAQTAATVEEEKVLRFAETNTAFRHALTCSGKAPSDYVAQFKEIRKAKPHLTAREYGVPEPYAN